MSIIRDIIHAAVSRGAEFNKLCSAIGLMPGDLNDSEKPVPFEPAARVWDEAIKQTGDPLLGLHIGETISPSILGITGYLMENCRTLHEALVLFCKFNNLYSTMLHYSTFSENNNVVMQFEPHIVWEKRFPESARQSVEISMAGLLRLFHLLADKRLIPLEAEQRYGKRYINEYDRILNCPIRFKAERNTLVFDKEVLLSSVIRHDISLFKFFNNALEQRLAQQKSSKGFIETVHEMILTTFKGQPPALEIAASTLNLTTRSFQRKLREENTTYREVMNEIKKELSLSMLKKKDIKVKDLAVLLGYSDSSAFRKAFKKWGG